MKKNLKKKVIIILISLMMLHFYLKCSPITSIQIFISTHNLDQKKYWVGEDSKIVIKKYPENSIEKIYFTSENNKIELLKNHFLLKASGRECLTAYTKLNKINTTICFNIYNTPELKFKENNPLKIEIKEVKQLHLDYKDYPKSNIKYKSSHPEIIKINNEGLISALRPGSSNITAYGLDFKSVQIQVLAISNNGLINNTILNINNAKLYQNLMIVAHPDDETLWGGANLFNESYFVVCLTNGYNLARANDYRKILEFTNNSGIILNYPDLKENNLRDDWSEVKNGILKDLLIILTFKNWKKIVTHGPDGTTGHIHHKKTCEYVTKIAKLCNKYSKLYYFGKFFRKNEIPKYLPRISDKDLSNKMKEISIYKSVERIIYKLWIHMVPYENWVKASIQKI